MRILKAILFVWVVIPQWSFAARDVTPYDSYLAQKEELVAAVTLYRQGKFHESVPIFEKLNNLGNSAGKYYYALALRDGAGIGKNEGESNKLFKKLFPGILQFAKKNDDVAQFIVGVMYRNGWGTKADINSAVKWYRKAAEQGHVTAQATLGDLYAQGDEIREDLVEAEKWYQRIAEQGNAEAQFQLGSVYYRGNNDYDKAIVWWLKAADQGHAGAQKMLGDVATDPDVAIGWWSMAAEQGNISAKDSIYDKYLSIGFKEPALRKKWSNLGLTFLNMKDWGPGFEPSDVVEWIRVGFPPKEAISCKTQGYSPADIAGFIKSGAALGDIKKVCDTISKQAKSEWDKNFTLNETIMWREAFAVEEATRWKTAGYTPKEVGGWRKLHITNVADAKKFDSTCPYKDGFISAVGLYQANPFDVAGKCYQFFGETMQILSRTAALFRMDDRIVYLDFGKGSAPNSYYNGIVKGVGVYEYTTSLGAVKKVPHLKSVWQIE